MEINGAQILIQALEQEGVNKIFGYPGGAVLEIYDCMKESSIEHILVRNEQGGVHAASGYARANGTVGVCMSTSGPGATNLVTGIATAYMDSVPLVVITGQVPKSMVGTDAFQEVDITGITSPITKHNYFVQKVEDLPRIVAEAFHIARTGRPGPVLIDIPRDVSMAKTEYIPVTEVEIRSYKPNLFGHPGMVKKAVKTIKDSQRLVVCVGGGVVISEATSLVEELVGKKNATVVSTMMGLGGYASHHNHFLGMLGTYGNRKANEAVQDCDCFLALGMRFDDRVIGLPEGFAPNATIIHIDVDPAEIGKNMSCQIPIVGDLKNVLKEINHGLDKAEELVQCSPYEKKTIAIDEDRLSVPWVIREIQRQVDVEQTIIATDVGQHQIWTANSYQFERPRSFISSGGLGTMGYGIPAAIGAQFAQPEKLVIVATGDGSFQMGMAELGVIMDYDLPIKVIVFNNHVLGMVRQLQYHYSAENYHGIYFKKGLDHMMLAKAYGAEGYQINSTKEAPAVLEKALNNGKFTIIECAIDADDLCLPIVLSGDDLGTMQG